MPPYDPNSPEIQADTPDPAINSISTDVSVGVTLAKLREDWTEAANDNRSVEVNGKEYDPKYLLERTDMVTRIIKKITPSFDDRKVEIEELPGQAVGEAKKETISWDPWLIAEAPIKAIVNTQVHEMTHAGGAVPDEAVVEAMARVRLKKAGLVVEGEKGLELTDKYISELQALYKLVSHLVEKGLGSADQLIEKIYNLCLNEGAEAVFELYDDEYISGLGSDDEKLKAFDLFEKAFPMMAVDNGHFALSKAVEEATEEAA
ncbi:MAG: hypothetical protein ABID64_05365 [Nitrospirota bacterium]